MTWKQFFISSVGKKFVMGLTGLFLIIFLVVHAGINACIWANDGGEMFNKAAHFMGATVVIRIAEVGLFAGIILHIYQGFLLTYENNTKRGKKYEVDFGNRGSKWYSRSMGLLGTLIFLFLIMHIAHFWVPSRITGLPEAAGKEYHDLFVVMKETFQSPIVVGLYLLGCISLCYHLMHGFQSAFRTLGLHNNRYLGMAASAGTAFAVIISIVFAAMPLTLHFGLVK